MSEGRPWFIREDFNTILSTRDRTGSDTNRQVEMVNFAEAIEDCRFLDPGFDGSDYTWAKNVLMKRLDRVLNAEQPGGGRAFRFQNMWVRHEGFADMVRGDWMAPSEATGLLNLKIKLARIKQTFKWWNREVFGNIHANLKACEKNIVVAQSEFEGDPSAQNRMEINKQIAEYVLLLKMEEDFWRQKAALRWLEEGDKNTRFYQSWVKQKRIRLRIHKINANGKELTDDLEIRDSAVEFYQNLLAPTYPE
ncbi:uncharacterized protein LOC121800872 [Salvia splendens]|uniref:uncharacterized protein LOC121800872 n=1 Tax=Salvia splendens TaxID=180675 RepID=UPI001C26E127|nr:uncharacterized protein LOC121800872 [Salvia splendens]